MNRLQVMELPKQYFTQGDNEYYMHVREGDAHNTTEAYIPSPYDWSNKKVFKVRKAAALKLNTPLTYVHAFSV